MAMIGYTTNALPGRVFSADEMARIIARRDNPTDFTPAMFDLLRVNGRGGLVSVTTLTGECPREHWLKQHTDYTINIESTLRAIAGTIAHSVMEQGPVPSAQKVLREQRMAKRIVMPDGRKIVIPFRFDELILFEGEKTWHIRDYKTTKSVPAYGSPWPTHVKQLSMYRYCLSDFPGDNPPLIWEGGENDYSGMADPESENWSYTAPIPVESGEVVYFSNETARRTMIGDGARTRFETLDAVHKFIVDRHSSYNAELPVSYADATSVRWGFEWKCNYCGLAAACSERRNSVELLESLSLNELRELAKKKGIGVVDDDDEL